ncbi:RNA polymerase sigma factor [Sphingobacterium gobiense]|uniref:Sigma-70 family RNA polymerase sigma factor n=1 Tax=Sphingobacterium gobiense TaxID=1382456 RepID=A0A2S9JGE5_9SPHI|nr:sigma-70 family RNA polymerase sigma factor [Sphingobacterium gobiense]PRD52026.1 sigma-70 family RNA polymerase sigma factor [Sphingobacterium gobiense]
MSTTIEAQWNNFIAGDKSAYEQIYRSLLPHLYEYGMRRTADETLVKDVIQDLFVKLWESREKLSGIANPKHYLLVALKNGLLNAQLRGDRLSAISEKEEFALTFNLESQIIKTEDERIKAAKLMQALGQLTAKQREVIYLRYFEELSYEEISTLTNISVKSLYKLNHRAMEALKEFLTLPKADIIALLSLLRFIFS